MADKTIVYDMPRRENHLTFYLNIDKRSHQQTQIFYHVKREKLPQQFIVSYINIRNSRHILLITIRMVDMLSECCNLVQRRNLFELLLNHSQRLCGMHAFAGHNTCTKQDPLAFEAMSLRGKRDYIAVYEAIKNLLPKVLLLN